MFKVVSVCVCVCVCYKHWGLYVCVQAKGVQAFVESSSGVVWLRVSIFNPPLNFARLRNICKCSRPIKPKRLPKQSKMSGIWIHTFTYTLAYLALVCVCYHRVPFFSPVFLHTHTHTWWCSVGGGLFVRDTFVERKSGNCSHTFLPIAMRALVWDEKYSTLEVSFVSNVHSQTHTDT